MVSPITEALEQYYSITTDPYTSPTTGEVDWTAFFAKREEVLSNLDSRIQPMVRDALQAADTTLEKELKAASTQLRIYYGLHDEILQNLEQTNPGLEIAYRTYLQQKKLAAQQSDPVNVRYYQRQSLEISLKNPGITQLEAMVRLSRKQARIESPAMELAYQMFVSGQALTQSTTGISRIQRIGGIGSLGRIPRL